MPVYRIALMLILAFAAGCSQRTPEKIPLGSWSYKLFMNGTEMGTAVTTHRQENGCYVSTELLQIKAGDVENISRQEIRETADFKPLSLRTDNQIITGGKVQNISTSAVFNGSEITVTANEATAKVSIEKPFVLSEHYFFKALAEQGFGKGAHAEADIYDPSFELEDTIRVKMAVEGRELVLVNGKPEKLLHISQIIENFKDIDLFLDGDGIMRKGKILMLNNKIELEINENE